MFTEDYYIGIHISSTGSGELLVDICSGTHHFFFFLCQEHYKTTLFSILNIQLIVISHYYHTGSGAIVTFLLLVL